MSLLLLWNASAKVPAAPVGGGVPRRKRRNVELILERTNAPNGELRYVLRPRRPATNRPTEAVPVQVHSAVPEQIRRAQSDVEDVVTALIVVVVL